MSALLFRLRWVILGLGFLGLGAGVAWITGIAGNSPGLLGTPLLVVPFMADDLFYYVNVAGFLAFFAVTQFLFLWPVRGLPITLATTGRPMWLSLLIGAFIATLITTGLIATILQLLESWESIIEPLWPAGIWIAMGISWVIWAGIFALICRRGDRYRRLRRMLRLLIAGSLLDLLIATPRPRRRRPKRKLLLRPWLLHRPGPGRHRPPMDLRPRRHAPDGEASLPACKNAATTRGGGDAPVGQDLSCRNDVGIRCGIRISHVHVIRELHREDMRALGHAGAAGVVGR